MLSLCLLGGAQIDWRGLPADRLNAAKSRALLCYLAVTGRPQPRHALAAMLWGEKGEAQGLVNLRQALHQLRDALPGCVATTRTSVAIDPGVAVEVDALRFAQLADKGLAGDRAALRAAIELYGGGFLEGLAVEQAPAFDEWVLREREWLRDLALQCMRALVADAVRERDLARGIADARRLLALEPWLEEAHRSLMQLLAWDGQVGAAVAQYERCRQVLAEELGVTPSAETAALRSQILAGAVPAPRPRDTPAPPAPPAAPDTARPPARVGPELVLGRPPLPNNLPAQRDPLIGRADEVESVRALLRQPVLRLLSLIGPGGVGKTGLALRVATQLLSDPAAPFRDGIYFVDLSPVGDAERVSATIARALNLRPQNDAPPLAALVEELRGRQMLLVLDNFEQVVDAAPQVAALLADCPQLKVLVTSRRLLRLRQERSFPVLPLAVPPLSPLPPTEQLIGFPAVALLVRRAQAALPSFRLDDSNAAAVAAICARVDGMPLAIELAAAWVRLFRPQTLLERLSNRLNLLTGGARDLPPRQQTLRATLDWSYHLLGPLERRLFAQLGVFVGGFTPEAVEAVCGEPADDEAAVLDALAALLDHSLLAEETGPDGAPRLRMLDTIRAYALEQLAARGEARALQERHARYWLAFVERVEPWLQGPDQANWLDRLEAEHDNLRAALAWGLTADDPAVPLRIAAALVEFWWPRGHLSEGRRWLARALERAPAPTPARAKALSHAGALAYGQNDITGALALLDESLALFRELGDRRGAAGALRSRGNVWAILGNPAQAAADRAESLALFRAEDDRWGMAWMLLEIGRDEPDPERQREMLRQSHELAQAGGYPRTVATALGNLGKLARAEGQPALARQLFEQALAIGRGLRDTWLSGWMLYTLAELADEDGDERRALTLRRESHALLSRMNYDF